MKKLPKTFGGAQVMRGLGMGEKSYRKLLNEKALDEFDARGDLWIVLDDKILRKGFASDVKAFKDRADAVRYARACGNGNVDQRVLHVTGQILVIATENEL